MNDKEIFWSLISPHLVDREPKVIGGFNYSLDEVIENWYDLKRFVSKNHKFILPDDVTWVEDGASVSGRYWQLPIDKYPNKMVLLRNSKGVLSDLWFDLPTVIIEVRLTQMPYSTTDYAMGGVEIYGKPVWKDPLWPYRTTLPSFVGSSQPFLYGVWPPLPSFINWRIDPFEVKS